MRVLIKTITAAVALCLSTFTHAAEVPRLKINFQQTQLANGLRVILLEDHRAPITSLVLVYDVGSANERVGRTGFAHLFEHLMFQGSQNVAAGTHTQTVASAGGNSNATTGTDFTLYFDSVPANQLDLALFLNADRLRSLNISQHNLTKEIEVVKEEKRQRTDNQPYRKSGAILDELMYDSFALGHDSSFADLEAASLQDIQQFFDTYYTAGNAALVLVGDFEPATALAKIEQHFGALPIRPAPPLADRTEPAQTQDRRQIVEDALAPLPQLRLAFKTVPGNHPDFYPLTVLSAVLQDGHSSRLRQALLQQRELATHVGGNMDESRGAGAFSVTAGLRTGVGIEQVEETIYREIERLQRKPIANWELEKAKTSIATSYLNGLHRGLIRAYTISRYLVGFNDPNRINTYIEGIASVSKADVQRVARTHLRKGNRTVVVTMPKQQVSVFPLPPGEGQGEGGTQRPHPALRATFSRGEKGNNHAPIEKAQ